MCTSLIGPPYDVVDSYYDESIDDYVDVVIPVNGYHEFYAYDGRGNVVHTMALDVTDLYILPFYYSTTILPEVDFNGDGLIDLTDLTRASSYYPIVRNYYYSPFGEIWQGEVSSDTNPFRYAGEYLDKETGDIYLRARYYNPSIGRFITVDPIKDGTNWYVYCSNNPIAFVDPSGLEDEEEKKKTLEDIFEITYNNTDPIKISIDENTVNVIVYVAITGNGADIICPGTNKTYRELYVEGIEAEWSTTQEFLTDGDSTYTVNVTVEDLYDDKVRLLYLDQKSIEIKILDSAGTSNVRWGIFSRWSKTNPGKTTIYTANRDGTIRSAQDFKYTCAHEFGHNLGIGDAYLNPVTTNRNDMMKWYNGVDPVVSKYDMWKVLKAFSQNKYQQF